MQEYSDYLAQEEKFYKDADSPQESAKEWCGCLENGETTRTNIVYATNYQPEVGLTF